MACKHERTANINAKCSDMCGISIDHLDFEHDGYVMDLGVGSGDYVDFNFCLDCGQIIGFEPVTDEQIKASEEWEQVKGTPEEIEAEEELVAAEPDVFSMKDIEKQRINKLMQENYGGFWKDYAEAREILKDTLDKPETKAPLREAILELLK